MGKSGVITEEFRGEENAVNALLDCHDLALSC